SPLQRSRRGRSLSPSSTLAPPNWQPTPATAPAATPNPPAKPSPPSSFARPHRAIGAFPSMQRSLPTRGRVSTARLADPHPPGPELSPLSPPPKPARILPPSPRMGGLQANSGGVSRVWSLPAAQVPVRPCGDERSPCRRTVPKTGAPRRFRLTILLYQRRKPSRGPSVYRQPRCRRRLGTSIDD